MDDAHVNPDALGALLLNSTAIALAVIHRERIAFANPAFVALFGAAGGMQGQLIADVVLDAEGDKLADALAATQIAPRRYYGMGRRAGEAVFDVELCLQQAALDCQTMVVAFAWDVTEQHRNREQLAFLAYTDPLTGLANRALLADRLHQAMQSARRYGTEFAVLMMDLDGFKTINDTYGHDAGDLALQLVGQRFQSCVRESDTLARIGGDEFTVLLPRRADRVVAAGVAQRLIGALQAPLDFGGQPIVVGVSIGIAAWPEHGASVDTLLAAADAAMYHAKQSGKSQFCWASGLGKADIVSLTPLAWTAAHSIGIDEIDQQHAHMAELIDRLSAALLDALESDTILAKVDELIRYTAAHFVTEERLMDQYRLPDMARHRDEHRRLLHDIRNLQVDNDRGSISLILRYLHEWLLRHVDGMDKQLGQALLEVSASDRPAGRLSDRADLAATAAPSCRTLPA
jgi:diguanylate cyclase (GGDEF)-like protein/hemerythrin-like metal-binding protein